MDAGRRPRRRGRLPGIDGPGRDAVLGRARRRHGARAARADVRAPVAAIARVLHLGQNRCGRVPARRGRDRDRARRHHDAPFRGRRLGHAHHGTGRHPHAGVAPRPDRRHPRPCDVSARLPVREGAHDGGPASHGGARGAQLAGRGAAHAGRDRTRPVLPRTGPGDQRVRRRKRSCARPRRQAQHAGGRCPRLHDLPDDRHHRGRLCHLGPRSDGGRPEPGHHGRAADLAGTPVRAARLAAEPQGRPRRRAAQHVARVGGA